MMWSAWKKRSGWRVGGMAVAALVLGLPLWASPRAPAPDIPQENAQESAKAPSSARRPVARASVTPLSLSTKDSPDEIPAYTPYTPQLGRPLPSTASSYYRPSLNFNGVPGLIDMPTAEGLPDGEMTASLSSFAGFSRVALTWQPTKRITGTFRYSQFQDLNFSGFEDYFDRAFDVRYQLLFESRYLPALTVGLQDFAGTGLYSGEYIVATKTLFDSVKVTGGIGWGRYGSYNSLGAPFGETRPSAGGDQGGSPSFDTYFRGNAALFGGLEWRPNEKWGLKVEYSSDAYGFEADNRGRFERASPFNFGVEYQVNDGLRLGAYSLYGDTLGFNVSVAMNPRRAPVPRSDRAPAPIQTRPDPGQFPEVYASDWVSQPARQQTLKTGLSEALKAEGQKLLGVTLEASIARVWVLNERHREPAGAAGRIARILAARLPASVERFEIIMMAGGIPVSTLTLARADLERLETEPNRAEALLARATFGPGAPLPNDQLLPGLYPKFNWRLSAFNQTSYFDPQNPLLIQVGLRARASVELRPGLVFGGAVAQRVGGNLNEARLSSTGAIPVVRTDWPRYWNVDTPQLENLTLSYATPLGNDLYGRVAAGQFERMYGGVSGEVLWKPVDSKLALGATLHHVRKREPDTLFEFEDYEVTSGFLSAYYELDSGYLGQIDVGRYLGGDHGATITLSREFANGWSMGAFATFTDVSAEDFGEGSFDKGITFSIPLGWGTGKPSRRAISHAIKPVQRDGGARIDTGSLYGAVRSAHQERYEDGWPLVWR